MHKGRGEAAEYDGKNDRYDAGQKDPVFDGG
jgi:hypothetical protein